MLSTHLYRFPASFNDWWILWFLLLIIEVLVFLNIYCLAQAFETCIVSSSGAYPDSIETVLTVLKPSGQNCSFYNICAKNFQVAQSYRATDVKSPSEKPQHNVQNEVGEGGSKAIWTMLKNWTFGSQWLPMFCTKFQWKCNFSWLFKHPERFYKATKTYFSFFVSTKFLTLTF